MSTPQQLRHAEIDALIKRVQACTWQEAEHYRKLGRDWPELVSRLGQLFDRLERDDGGGLRFGPRRPADPPQPGSPSPAMLDPDTEPLSELNRELAELQKRYATASHVVGERHERPDGIDDATFEWWIAARNAMWRRRFEINQPSQTAPAEQPELRKDRLRKPPR